MKGGETFIKDFVSDLPRGVRTVHRKRQTVPQAGWQDLERVLESKLLAYDPADPGGKILVGALGSQLIGIEDNRHILTVAGSRAGKSVTIINNLLFYRGSVLCTDPKAELASITAARRADLGQKVYVLDPFERCAPAVAKYRRAYNPLSILRRDNPSVIEDAGLIADALVIAGGKDPHWDDSARNFIEGLILHVATDPVYEGRRDLITVRKLIRNALVDSEEEPENPDDEPAKALELEMLRNAARIEQVEMDEDLAGAIEGAARDFFEKAGTERAGVLSTVRRHTKLLDYKAMRRVLTGHDFVLTDLKRDPAGISVYLCLPAGRMGACSRWLRIFINQLLDAMEREPTRSSSPPVLACLDEFPVLGFMSQLQDAAGQVASFNLKLWVVLQDWGQGKALYKERWESFAANAGILQAFGNADLTTTEYLSKRLGKTPVEITRTAEVGQEQSDSGLTGRSQGLELHDLLTPEEVSRMFSRDDPFKRQLVIWSGYRPMTLQRVEYFNNSARHYRAFQHIFNLSPGSAR